LRHAARAGDSTKRLGNECRIIRFQSFFQVRADGFVAVQIFGGVEAGGFHCHDPGSNCAASALAALMSFACELLSPPHNNTISVRLCRVNYTR